MRIALAWLDLSDPTDRAISKNLARELRHLGHEVCLVGPRRRANEPFRERWNGSAVYRVGPGEDLAVRQLLGIHSREAIDVWHCHVFARDHGPFSRASRLARWPLLVTLHLVLEDYLPFLGGKAGLRRLLASARHVTTVARRARAEFLRLCPGWRDRSSVVHCGTAALPAARARTRARGGVRILSVARLAPYKGQDLLLMAFARLLERGVRARLVLCGRDQLHGALQGFARSLGLAGRVAFTGQVPAARVRRLLRDCDFFVLPSRRENFPLAVLEAMSAGKPVLAFAAGGVSEMLRHGREGLLVAPNDVAGLARGMFKLCADPALARRLGRGALRRSRDFSWRRAAAAYVRLYERASASRSRAAGMRSQK